MLCWFDSLASGESVGLAISIVGLHDFLILPSYFADYRQRAFADFPLLHPLHVPQGTAIESAGNPAEEISQKKGSGEEQPVELACDLLSESPKSLADKLENLGRLYENEEHPIMQEWWFLGRYHGQYYNADAEAANQEGWENRRFRIGSQARFFEKMTLHSQMVSGTDIAPFYNGFTELWSQWAFDESFAITLGQQKHRFTHDRNVSSRYLNTLERSMLTNAFNADYTPAVTASGASDKFAYYIAGHRLKLMNGIEYATMNGQDVRTASIAFWTFWGPNSNGPFPMAKMLEPRW